MIGPGSTIGIFGGGQLGRMTVLAGRHLGYRFSILDPAPNCAAGMVADHVHQAPYDASEAVLALARQCEVLTLEFENVPARSLELAASLRPVRPGAEAASVCQNRRAEKEFLRRHGIPCAPFQVVATEGEFRRAVEEVGIPGVLKTASFGYDGKGQVKVTEGSRQALAQVWSSMGGNPCVYEQWIEFSGEYSVICARRPSGQSAVFPMAENTHRHHILHTSSIPARLPDPLRSQAEGLALRLAERLGLEGLLAVELFLTRSGQWLVNEMAPRPHNSGHFSIDACLTSQFEQHVRAVCDLPLGATSLHAPVVMVNLLGDLWHPSTPAWEDLLADPTVKLHLYDKGEPRPGRKMGHFCVLGPSLEEAESRARWHYDRLCRL